MKDQFPARRPDAAARGGFAITPANADLPEVPRALWVGTAGHLNLVFDAGSSAVLFKNVPVGLWPFSPTQVQPVTGSAADIVGVV